MVEIDQDLQPAPSDLVRFPALDVDDEADAARIVLVSRIVQPLSRRRCHYARYPPPAIRGCRRAPGKRKRRSMHRLISECESPLRFAGRKPQPIRRTSTTPDPGSRISAVRPSIRALWALLRMT